MGGGVGGVTSERWAPAVPPRVLKAGVVKER
jgi:hypothetical protein